MSRRTTAVLAFILISTVSACVVVRTVSVESMTAQQAVGSDVRTPLKVFHTDGTISVFPSGARVTTEAVLGLASHYSLDLSTRSPIESVPLDSIVGIEAFRGGVAAGATVAFSVLATAGIILGAVGIACAADPKCFGSCPTIYTYEDGEEVLEAEAFSYSIAPLLEARDVDRLGARTSPDGRLRLEVRNEALETHYINHLEVLEARHTPDRRAYPNEGGRIVSVGQEVAPISVVDRDGAPRTHELVARDALAFASTEERIRAVTGEDYWDHIDLTFPKPAGEDAALVLRLRNSLLNSVLFYDLMLGSRGVEALEWLGSGINRIGEAVELGRWFNATMGLRVSVMGPDGWESVTRVGDTGPIAWKELAVTVPVPEGTGDELRIRLAFLADEWRIDYAGLAGDVERASVEVLPVASIARIGDDPDDELRAQLAEPDEEYLVTVAGTALSLEFEPTQGLADAERTFFLSSQGYYTEWIRPEWIRASVATEGFSPSEEVVGDLMDRWLEEKTEFEQKFFETRIPVR